MDVSHRDRQQMIQNQVAARGIDDARVLAAMARVDRAAFLPADRRAQAYEDPLQPIGEGAAMPKPYVLALMAQIARIDRDDRVLEVGTGSGYRAAVLSRLARRVDTIERRPPLAHAARTRLDAAGYSSVRVTVGDGTLGRPAAAPFDAILVCAGAPSVPAPLMTQLSMGGRLVIPVGDPASREGARLVRVVRTGPASWSQEPLATVRLPPLIGAHGWAPRGVFPRVPGDPGRAG